MVNINIQIPDEVHSYHNHRKGAYSWDKYLTDILKAIKEKETKAGGK